MTDFPNCIPHFTTDRQVNAFFRVTMNVEFIDGIASQRHSARAGTDYARHLRESLEYLVENRPATTREWAVLTQVSFWEEDRLYGYLAELIAYFYGDRKDAPQAPDPEEIPPEKYWK